jgi:periplasmic protein TonB
MKFRSLKLITAGIIAVAACVFMQACNDESGNNSSTTPANGADSSAAAMGTDPGREPNAAGTKKRLGKVSATLPAEADANAKMEMDKMGYYNRTEVLPAYKGGQPALENYINNNIEYPQDAIDNNIEGTVSVQFAVDEQGGISNVSTIGTKTGYGLEEEAIKVISNMPKWTAGQIKGKNVKTWRILPITYKLES